MPDPVELQSIILYQQIPYGPSLSRTYPYAATIHREAVTGEFQKAHKKLSCPKAIQGYVHSGLAVIRCRQVSLQRQSSSSGRFPAEWHIRSFPLSVLSHGR